MAGDRRINFGSSGADATYRIEDSGDGANFVLAEDLDGNTVLLQWNPSTSPSQWEFAGKVDMGNNDLVNVNSLEVAQVNDSNGTAILGESVASGSVTLSSGSATVDTGVGVGNTATFFVALGPDTDDADVAAEIRANSGNNYEVDIDETATSVGNPTINYDIVRVR